MLRIPRRPLPLITLGLALLFAVLLFLYLLPPEGMTPAADPARTPGQFIPAPSPTLPRTTNRTAGADDPSVIRSQAQTAGSEIYPAESMEALVHTVDQALVGVLRDLNVDTSDIEFLEVHRETRNDETFTVQTLRLPLSVSSLKLLEALNSALHGEIFSIFAEHGELHVIVDGMLTHRFVEMPPPYLPTKSGPKVVVVIDDMGENMAVARDLAALQAPIVFAVWPNSSQAAEVRALARKHHLDLLVHLPMEPIGYPKDKPGKQALFVSMSDADLDKNILANLTKVPEAVGVNNHMGSRFTGDQRGMDRLMRILKQRNLFFLDSKTTPHSVGRSAARQATLPFYGRDVFLDNSLSVSDITLQLKKVERLARQNGVAIAIGHPHSQTVVALRDWLRKLDPAISVVPLTALSPQ